MHVCVCVPSRWKGTVSASTMTGALDLRDLSGSDLVASTVSGAVSVTNLEGITLSLKTVSGPVTGSALYAEQASLRTVSGEIGIEGGAFRHISVRTAAGLVQLALSVPPERMKCLSGSGIVRVFAPLDSVDACIRSLTGRLRTGGLSLTEGAASFSAVTLCSDLELYSNIDHTITQPEG